MDVKNSVDVWTLCILSSDEKTWTYWYACKIAQNRIKTNTALLVFSSQTFEAKATTSIVSLHQPKKSMLPKNK